MTESNVDVPARSILLNLELRTALQLRIGRQRMRDGRFEKCTIVHVYYVGEAPTVHVNATSLMRVHGVNSIAIQLQSQIFFMMFQFDLQLRVL